MKKIEIITRPDKLDIIKKILAQNEYSGMTVTAAMGCGRQKADAKDFEEILVELQQKLTTGILGDGKIFISTIDDVVRIRTGERGYKTL